MEKYIYVVLSAPHTVPGKVIRKITKNSYSHVSISLDKNLNEMYSFARFHYQNPLVGGFVHENADNLSLKKTADTFIKIFEIPVTSKQYKSICNLITYFQENEKKYMYNLLDLILYPTGIRCKIKDAYICSEFVAYLLRESKIEVDKIDSTRIIPSQLITILQEYEYYDGNLQNYIATVEHEKFENHYFEKENIFFVIWKSIVQIGKLLFRKII